MKPPRALLVCGVLSSLLYVVIDMVAAICCTDFHSFTSQTISELMARGAPTKPFVDPLFLFYDVLAIAFGIGVWMCARRNRPLRVTAGLLVGYGIVGLPGPRFFPMNLRGAGDTGEDIRHIILTGVIVLFIIGAVGFGAFALGQRFRSYSYATLLTIVVFGVLSGIGARELATGAPTPWIGLAERANIGAFLLWVAVLAFSLLRSQQSTAATSS